jgi:hypothetical protein
MANQEERGGSSGAGGRPDASGVTVRPMDHLRPGEVAGAGPDPDVTEQRPTLGGHDPQTRGDDTDAKGGDTQAPHMQGSHQSPS